MSGAFHKAGEHTGSPLLREVVLDEFQQGGEGFISALALSHDFNRMTMLHSESEH